MRAAICQPTLVGNKEAWPFLPSPVKLALRILTVRDFMRIAASD